MRAILILSIFKAIRKLVNTIVELDDTPQTEECFSDRENYLIGIAFTIQQILDKNNINEN